MSRPSRVAGPSADTGSLTYSLAAASGALWLGLGPVSVGGLAVTLTVTVGLLLGGAPLAGVVPVLALGAAVSTMPVAGRPVLAWIPDYLGLQLARARGTGRWRRPLQDVLGNPGGTLPAGQPARVRAQAIGVGPSHLRLTACYALSSAAPSAAGRRGPSARASSGAEECLGVISHARRAGHGDGRRASGRRTIVMEVIGLGRFGLLDPADQDTELGRWGSCLATLCADPAVRNLQWLTHSRPDTATRHHSRLSSNACASGGASACDCLHHSGWDDARDYSGLVDRCADSATRHRHLLAITLQLPQPHAAPDTTRDPGSAAHDEPTRQAARDISTALLAADLLARPLGPADLGESIRSLLDPEFDLDVRPGSDAVDRNIGDLEQDSQVAAAPRHPGAEPARWLPLSTRKGWDHCRTDDTVHRCYVVTGWPRLALTADWLSPLLQTPPLAGSSTTLSVHARPVAAEHASRRARAAGTKARLDAHDRNRMGFTAGGQAPRVADALAESDALATEAELAAGYRMTDLSALLTVSANNEQTLQSACRQLRGLAVAHRLELRPLHGQHLTALANTLPLGLHPGATS